MSSPIISDSEPEEVGILSRDYVDTLDVPSRKKRKGPSIRALMDLQSDVDLTPRKKTRTHGFYQRHVYTTDLAGYLNLASREQLDKLSQKGVPDDKIEYMLNRKYIKLRRFCEKHEVSRHRYRKHDFTTYLEDFKKYQSSTSNRPKRSIYETMDDDNIEDKKDKREMLKLQRMKLESIVTTDEESEEEEEEQEEKEEEQVEQKEDNITEVAVNVGRENYRVQSKMPDLESPSLTQPNNEPLDQNESYSNSDNNAQRTSMGSTEARIVSTDESRTVDVQPAKSHSDADRSINELLIPPMIDIDDLITKNRQSIPVVPAEDLDIPNLHVELLSEDLESMGNVPLHSDPPNSAVNRRRRTRQHKFTQDHVYVTDTAIYLGLCSSYLLNDMFENGKTYKEIVDFLNDEYVKKRKDREKREIGLGPFSRASFYSYINENPVIANGGDDQGTTNPLNNDFLMNDAGLESSDGEYQEDRSTVAPTQRESSSDESDDDNEVDPDAEAANFMFRKKMINREKALKGVLPKSFLKVNPGANRKTAHKISKTHSIDRPGLAKKKKSGHRPNEDEHWNAFLADDNEPVGSDNDDEIPPYNAFDASAQDFSVYSDERDNTPGLDLQVLISDLEDESDSLSESDSLVEENAKDDDDDDGIGIKQYDSIIKEMRSGFLTDMAEEDDRSGSDYMLAPRERKSGPRVNKSAKKSKTAPSTTLGQASSKRPTISASNQRGTSARKGVKTSKWGSSVMKRRKADRSRQLTFPKSNATRFQSFEFTDLSDDENYDIEMQAAIWKSANDISSGNIQYSVRDINQRTVGNLNGMQSKASSILTAGHSGKSAALAPFKVPAAKAHKYESRNRILGTAQLEREVSVEEWQQRRFPNGSIKGAIDNVVDLSSSSYDETVKRLEKQVNKQPSISDIDVSLSKFQRLRLPEKSFCNSALYSLCFDVGNDYEYDVPLTISFDFGNHHITLHPGNIKEAPQMVEALMRSLNSLIEGVEPISKENLKSIRNLYIKLVELIWMLEDSNLLLLDLSKVFRKVTKKLIDTLTLSSRNSKLAIFTLPYHQLIVHSLSQLLSNKNQHSVWEAIILKIERQMVLHSCTMSKSAFLRCMAGQDDSIFYLDSYKIFLRLSKNPWRLVAGFARSHAFKYENILNWLYFLHSQQPVFYDWEYFIQEIDSLKDSKNYDKWKKVLYSLHGIIRDLKWEFEEQLIIRIYRLLGTQRFENIAETRNQTTILSYLPSTDFSTRDGCLDMYFRYLVMYSKGYLSDTKRSSFLEKIIPISDIKTSSIGLLKNRINMILVVTMLFKCDLDSYLMNILNALGAFGSVDCYGAISDALFAILKVYVRDLGKLPIASLKTTSFVINAINELRVTDYSVAPNFKDMLDTLEIYSNSNLNPQKLMNLIDLAGMFLTIRKVDFSSKLSKVVYRALALIQHMFPKIKKLLTGYNQSNKLRKKVTQLIPELKNIISGANNNNELLKKTCVAVWVRASFILGISIESLVFNDWLFFETSVLRSRYELEFYSVVIEEYSPTQSLSSIRDKLLVLLVSTLPLLDIPSFFRFFIQLGKVKEIADYIKFRNGTDPTKFTALEFSQRKAQITVKILAKVIMDYKYNKKLHNNLELISIFLRKLKVEYWAQKERQLRHLLHREYTISVIRYLHTVAYDLVGRIPEFVTLSRELDIHDITAPLHERINIVASDSDFVSIVEESYIKAFINNTVDDFSLEMTETFNQVSDFSKNSEKLFQRSTFYPICLLVSLHMDFIVWDSMSDHFIHLQFWLRFLSLQLKERGSLVPADVYCVVKLIKSLSVLTDKDHQSYSYYQCMILDTILDILLQLSFHLQGFADQENFISLLPRLLVYPRLQPSGGVSTANTFQDFNIPFSFDHQMKLKLKQTYEAHQQILERIFVERDIQRYAVFEGELARAMEGLGKCRTDKLQLLESLDATSTTI